MKRRLTSAMLIASALAIALGCKRSERESAASVDRFFAEWNRRDSPGCGVGVSRNGVVAYERGFGLANVELGAPITTDSVFHVASISKQFTAMSILLLAQQGKLSLDDPVSTFVPDWADRDDHVTVRNLLTHTAGVRDGFALLAMAPAREDGLDVNDSIVGMLARQRSTNFKPGSEFQYSNAGYTLLANIVKRVSGQSLRSFADENIFKPLGMTHTHVHDDPTMIVPNRAWGYHRDGDIIQAAVHGDLGRLVGTTGLFTTARDLLLWEQNFVTARVGGRALVESMQAPAIPTGWADGSSYGFGLEIGRYRGARTIGHGGGDPGYGAFAVRYPDYGLAIAVLCNLDNVGIIVSRLAERVADVYLADVLAPSATTTAAPPPVVSLKPEQLSGKAGLYRNAATDSVGRVFVRNGRLMASASAGEENSVELTPVAEDRFVVAGTPLAVEFVPADGDRPQEIRVTGEGPTPVISQLVPPFALSDREIREIEGEYVSPELPATYTIVRRDSGLMIQIPGRADIRLQPVFKDGFAGPIGVVKLSRDAHGVVKGFTVKSADVRGLSFDRVNHR